MPFYTYRYSSPFNLEPSPTDLADGFDLEEFVFQNDKNLPDEELLMRPSFIIHNKQQQKKKNKKNNQNDSPNNSSSSNYNNKNQDDGFDSNLDFISLEGLRDRNNSSGNRGQRGGGRGGRGRGGQGTRSIIFLSVFINTIIIHLVLIKKYSFSFAIIYHWGRTWKVELWRCRVSPVLFFEQQEIQLS